MAIELRQHLASSLLEKDILWHDFRPLQPLHPLQHTFSRCLTTSLWSMMDASMSALILSLSVALTSAPRCNSTFTTS